MKCSPEFRARVAKQAELARRGTGRGYTGQLTFTYGEVKWILADLEELHRIQTSEPIVYRTDGTSEPPRYRADGQPRGEHII